MDRLKALEKAFILLVTVVLVGTLGYMIIEGQSFLNAFYMVIITITTIGYGETFVLGTGGRIFTIFLVIAGVGTVGYTLVSAVEFMIENSFSGIMGRRKMRKDIENMVGHYILCGYGRVGQHIADDLKDADAEFIIIENDPTATDKALENGFLVIRNDATSDIVLKSAGIENAKGLVTALSSDAENLYITLTARELCPHLFIVSRCDTEESGYKLRRAGADRVISPHSIGGRRMAAMLLKPMVWDYLDLVTKGQYIEFNIENLEWRIDDVEIQPNSYLDGKSIDEAKIYSISGALVLAVKKRGSKFNTKPSKDIHLDAGDYIIAIGTVDQLAKLEELSESKTWSQGGRYTS
ncbi:MAG: potassium channel protein [Actinomycetota bacterium]|nr:potassium channel protein [Actinomycetota bacterium]